MGGVPHDGGHVDVGGNLPAEGLVEQVVLGRGGQVLHAAHDVGDAHQVIVNDVGEVVGGHAVLLDEDHVIEGVVGEGHVPEHLVMIAGLALGGGILTDDVGHARVQLGLNLLRGQVQAVLVVLEHLAPGLGGGAALLQLLLGAEAVVGVAGPNQLLGVGQVEVLALGLDVGAAGAAHIGALVPVHAAVPQGVVDDLRRALHVALLVGVLNAEDEVAAHLLGEEIPVERRAQSAQVQEARGGGGKACAYLLHGKSSFLCRWITCPWRRSPSGPPSGCTRAVRGWNRDPCRNSRCAGTGRWRPPRSRG